MVKEKSEVAGSEELELGNLKHTMEEKSRGELMQINWLPAMGNSEIHVKYSNKLIFAAAAWPHAFLRCR